LSLSFIVLITCHWISLSHGAWSRGLRVAASRLEGDALRARQSSQTKNCLWAALISVITQHECAMSSVTVMSVLICLTPIAAFKHQQTTHLLVDKWSVLHKIQPDLPSQLW